MIALFLSIIVTIVGLFFLIFKTVTSITREFDFSELLVNVMLPFYFAALGKYMSF